MSEAKQPRDVDVIVGANVRKFRNKLDLSQTQLADAIGVTFQQVQKYEKGTNRMSASRLHQVATYFGTRVEALFAGVESADAAVAVPEVSQAAMRCALAFDRIQDEKIRQRISGLVKTLAGEAEAA